METIVKFSSLSIRESLFTIPFYYSFLLQGNLGTIERVDLKENCGLSITHEYTQIIANVIRWSSGKQTIGTVIEIRL